MTRRLVGASAFVLLAFWGPAGAAFSAPPALPEGLVWVDRAASAATSTLHRVTASGAVRDQRLAYRVNAIGCTPAGVIYGLAEIAGGPHLLRITGAVKDLGPIAGGASRYPLAEGYAATVQGAHLVVASGSFVREVRLDRPALTASRPLPALPYIGDWVSDPRTGELVAVAGERGAAYVLRLGVPVSRTSVPGLPGGPAYGALALGPGRVLYTVYNGAGSSRLYRVPLDAPSHAALVRTLGPAASSDATYCAPVAARISGQAVPPPVAPPAASSPSPAAAPSAAPRRPSGRPTPSRVRTVAAAPGPMAPSPAPSPSPAPPRPAAMPPLPVAPVPTVARSFVSKRLIPIVGGAMTVALVAIRRSRHARAVRAGRRAS
jgi:hypothetical protein